MWQRQKSLHRMAGRSVPPPKRELFVPPPGWVPPTKPVTSWYDMGLRLAPAAPAAVPKAVPVNPVQALFNNLFSSGASSRPLSSTHRQPRRTPSACASLFGGAFSTSVRSCRSMVSMAS